MAATPSTASTIGVARTTAVRHSGPPARVTAAASSADGR